MRPFFSFYGGKWRAAPRYPAPRHDTVIEPFAGSAGYSVRHFARSVRLYDIDEKVIATWQFLIGASERDILTLPLLGPEDDVRALPISQEARWLVGWWLNKGMTAPCNIPGQWMRSQMPLVPRSENFWGAGVRQRLAKQVSQIRHWHAERCSYDQIPDQHATWFIDPPYIDSAGRRYTHGNRTIDYAALGAWCQSRNGQVIVCENADATWLPFEPFGMIKTTAGHGRVGTNAEGIWVNPDHLTSE